MSECSGFSGKAQRGNGVGDSEQRLPKNVIDFARYSRPFTSHGLDQASAPSTAAIAEGLAQKSCDIDFFDSESVHHQATVLSFIKECEFRASIEIDLLTTISTEYHQAGVEGVIAEVGDLLRAEFGALSVRRETRLFSIVHDDFEQLVAGILRVQFYSNLIELPEYNIFGEKTRQNGLTLTWGVGRCPDEAINERKKKKRCKEQRRLGRG